MTQAEVIDLLRRTRAALEDKKALPEDCRRWLTQGLRQYARGAETLDGALGLNVGPGGAWDHPGRLLIRASLEWMYLQAAEHLPGTTSAKATELSRALRSWSTPEHKGPVNLWLSKIQAFDDPPTSRTAIQQILDGNTRAQRSGLCRRSPEYSGSHTTLGESRYEQ